ncbi:MAG: hypothetical protein ABTB30_16545 [Clostridia bacterium]
MKKLIGILLAIMMLATMACAASADEVPQPEGGKKFESDWVIPGGKADIYYEEEGYRVTLEITKDDGTGSRWEYSCYYHEDTDSLSSVSSSKLDYTINPDTGDQVTGDYAYEGMDEEKQGTEFSIDADGFLIWKDGREDAGAGLKFTNIGRFDGLWKNQEEEIEVQFAWNGQTEDEMFYTVYLTRGKTDGDVYAQFLMNGFYDPATGKLTADGTCTLYTKNASGEYESSEDGESYEAIFSKTEDGKLYYETDNGIELEYDIMGVQG